MSADRKAEFLAVVTGAEADLQHLAQSSETEIEPVARAFRSLAGEADTILKKAAAIVGCVEKESMGAVLFTVRELCQAVRTFLERRLEAATTILRTLHEQERLLQQLAVVTENQKLIARQLRALSVLTNVEVAHLGSAGVDFHLLAQELSVFSTALSEQTLELATDTANRQQTMAATRGELAADLPRLRHEIALMEDDVGRTLGAIEAGIRQQAAIPAQFRRCAEETSQQIAGVVAAIQAHDITRQQIEHVQHALKLIASRIAAADHSRGHDLAAAHAGLGLQICQLKNSQETVVSWTAQVRRCMQGIAQLSASEVSGIGPTVLQQERELSLQLAHMEQLQQKSGDYSVRMQSTLGGLSSLVDLVNDDLRRSQAIRGRLQILMFNSLLEAVRLGRRGAVVSAIANLIKAVSAEWNALAEQSRLVLSQLLGLVQETTALLEVFSETSRQKLRADQAQTRAALDKARSAAAFVAKEAAQMQAVMETMQANLAAVGHSGSRLESCFARLDPVLGQIEGLAGALEKDDPQLAAGCDTAEVERWLSAFYTTEIERHIMRAALHGISLPVPRQSFEGNAVELF